MPHWAGGQAADAATVQAMQADTARRKPRPSPRRSINAAEGNRFWSEIGRLPPIVLSAGVGLLVCSIANALSRATLAPSPLIFWAGILILALPIFYRLTSEDASTGERFTLVCLLGIALYGVKIVRDVPIFTFSDELVHAYNANQIVAHHHLFHGNPVLRVTPFYPGLEGTTSALATMTGLSSYAAGVIVIGAARLTLLAALFLLFLRVSGSGRIAGLASAIYTCNFNFVYWGAQYSYESLALPLLVVALMALAEREAAPQRQARDWAAPILLVIAAVTVTHHLTSYALVTALAVLSLAGWLIRRTWRPPNPWPFATFAAVMAIAWLVVVASSTVGYLSPVLSNAVTAIAHTISGEAAPRALFQGEHSTAAPTPFMARAVALLAVALPFGLRETWRKYREQPFALVFALAAIGFFGTLALRLTPPAWETGNRASEFLFIGLAFVLACAGLAALRHWSSARRGRALLAAAIGLVLVGGAISGWPWDSQLDRPLRVTAHGGTIVSQPLAMAEWAADEVPGGRFAATTADANLLLVPGGKAVRTGPYPDVEDVLTDPRLPPWELRLLRHNRLRYVVADRRIASSDSVRGYYFSTNSPNAGGQLLPKGVVTKFNRVPGVARIYTNGAITVYDLKGEP